MPGDGSRVVSAIQPEWRPNDSDPREWGILPPVPGRGFRASE